jgi:DNA-binding MarR family transcriptional regulator
MAAQPTPRRLGAWRAFLEAHATVTGALERELQDERGLSLAWYDVLVQLAEAPGGRLRMGDLSRSVLLSKSGLTRLCDRMESGGYVRREATAEDARGLVAVITPSGRAALRRAAPVHMRGVQRHFARHISDDDARSLTAALRRITDANEDR